MVFKCLTFIFFYLENFTLNCETNSKYNFHRSMTTNHPATAWTTERSGKEWG